MRENQEEEIKDLKYMAQTSPKVAPTPVQQTPVYVQQAPVYTTTTPTVGTVPTGSSGNVAVNLLQVFL